MEVRPMSEVNQRKSLPDLVKELQVYHWQLEISGGEITPEIEAIENYLAVALPQKADAMAYVMERLEALAEADRAEAAAIGKSAKAKENAVKRLKDLIKTQLMAAGIDELRGDTATFKLSPRGSKLQIDEATLPADYWAEKITKEPNRQYIADCLDADETIAGVTEIPITALLITKGRKL